MGHHIVGISACLLRSTVRLKVIDQKYSIEAMKDSGKIIYAFWHEDLAAVAKAGRIEYKIHRPIYAMISQSTDGDILAKSVSWLGIQAVRGSSSHGGTAALKRMIEILNHEGNVALAVDGPRGPLHTIHPGIFLIAKMTGAAIVPLTWKYDKTWTFKSWDKAKLAKPFSTIQLKFHPAFYIKKDSTKADFQNAEVILRKALDSEKSDSK